MAGGIKGLTVVIDGNTTKLGQALNAAEKQSKACSSELKEINKQLKLDPSNVQLAAQKQQVLKEAIAATEKKLATLKDAQAQVQAQFERGEIGADEYRSFERELIRTEQRLENLKKQAEAAGAAVEESGEQTKKAGKNSKDAGKDFEKLEQSMEKVTDTAKKVGAVAVSALAALAGATTAAAKSAIEAYGEYEQLKGGVDTLFGSSASIVEGYARNAYKTAGMSANKYMETVTGFSASLLQSLGGDTQAAAKKADMAITDMSDNANKMGSDISAIQNAYQGFAKQTYTMLDNLKLGYGGTKEEMERLLADAAEISGIEYDISSYSDIIDAIHVIQTELGITGTTALEASTTIQGSWGAVQASLSNFVAGLSDDTKDMDSLMDNLRESTETFVGNLAPRLETFFSRFGVKIDGEKLKKSISRVFDYVTQTAIPGALRGLNWIITHGKSILAVVKAVGVGIATSKAVSFVGNVVSSVKTLVSAITAAKTSQDGLNLAMKSNLAGLAASGISLLISYLSHFGDRAKEAREEQERLNAVYRDAAEAATQSAQKQRDAARIINEEFDTYESLWKSLQSLVDENGRVKAGYEDRVNYITGELSQATGIEISQVDGVISKYAELCDQMDELLVKKRGTKMLDSMEGNYGTAVNTVGSMETDADGLYQIGSQAAAEQARTSYEAATKALADAQAAYDAFYNNTNPETNPARYDMQVLNLELDLEAASQSVVDAQQRMTDARLAYDKNMALISQYSELEEALLAGNSDSIAAAMETASDNLMTAQTASLDSLVSQQEATQTAYDQLAEFAKSDSSTYSSMQLADAFALNLKAMTETYSAMMKENSGATDKEIAVQEGKLRQALAESGQFTAQEIENILGQAAEGAIALGQMYGDGFVEGIEAKIEKAKEAGRELAKAADEGVREEAIIESPSKKARKTGGYYGEGLALGIEDQEETVAARAVRLAQKLNDSLSGAMSLPVLRMAEEDVRLYGGRSPSSIHSGDGASIGGMGDIYAKLDALLRAVEGIDPKLYLDDGTLVGHTARKTDRALGEIAAREERGRLV